MKTRIACLLVAFTTLVLPDIAYAYACGNGAVHRYYACSTCARKGKTVCKGRSIPMAKLDTLVTTHMNERLFQPESLAMILSSLSSRRPEKANAVNARVTALRVRSPTPTTSSGGSIG